MTLPVYLAVLALLCFAIAATSWVLKLGAGAADGVGAEHSGREPSAEAASACQALSEPTVVTPPIRVGKASSRPDREWVLERTRPYDREGDAA